MKGFGIEGKVYKVGKNGVCIYIYAKRGGEKLRKHIGKKVTGIIFIENSDK